MLNWKMVDSTYKNVILLTRMTELFNVISHNHGVLKYILLYEKYISSLGERKES